MAQHLQILRTLPFSNYEQRAVRISQGTVTFFPAISAKSSLVDSYWCLGSSTTSVNRSGDLTRVLFILGSLSQISLCNTLFSGSDSLQIQLLTSFLPTLSSR